jgi:wyosine [tRNA(Phe)-imidazoG37] synthetase (radical SAM superfamily)
MDFTDHRRELNRNRYVYAVVSRRAGGLSIGINLNPDKACNFDCPYCQVDRTGVLPDGKVELKGLQEELEHLLKLVKGELWSIAPFDTAALEHRTIIDIAFAGDGEPTAARNFKEAAGLVKMVRDKAGLRMPIRLLTNATLLDRAGVQEGLTAIDELWCKLDAGTEAWYKKVDGTVFPYKKVLKNLEWLAKKRPVVLQCMFFRLGEEEPSEEEIVAWAGRIVDIVAAGGQIAEVQVYTVARKPSDVRVVPLSLERLKEIGVEAAKTGVPVRVVG